MKLITLNKSDATNLSDRDTSPTGYVYFGYEAGVLSLRDGDTITDVGGGDFLPLAGGTLTGALLFDTNQSFTGTTTDLTIVNTNGGLLTETIKFQQLFGENTGEFSIRGDGFSYTGAETLASINFKPVGVGSTGIEQVISQGDPSNKIAKQNWELIGVGTVTHQWPNSSGIVAVSTTAGFTGTGAYTNFTIENGVITSAS
jgi:hypothetical protein